ncbi:MAG: FAD-binding oxidoreductase [Alphaproteobacteria bacterium]|nr:FAD-binding oxidoreductase [Alphaproteobacteria bacterium]
MVQTVASFDRGVEAAVTMRRPDRYLAFRADDFPPTAIARGAGLSYAAASFADGGTSLSMTEFSRIIQWDEERALIRVEAGIRLFDLFRFLAERRHFLPIQPGHGLITVGGCIAANVHGKWGGGDTTFASQVQSLRLFHPSHGIVELSDTELPDVFNLTCGGYGLTGVILDATLRVKPLNSSVCKVQFIEIDDLDGSAAKITEIATCSAFLYTWHDFSRRGNGHAVRIDFADEGGRARRPLVPNPKSPRRSFPFCAYSGSRSRRSITSTKNFKCGGASRFPISLPRSSPFMHFSSIFVCSGPAAFIRIR